MATHLSVRMGELWEAVALTGARDPRGMAEHLTSLTGKSHLLGLWGSKPELDWRPYCLCKLIAPHLFSMISFHSCVLASDFSNRSSTFSMCPSSLSSFDQQFSTLPSSEDSVSLHFPESHMKQLTPLVERPTHSAALWNRSASPVKRNTMVLPLRPGHWGRMDHTLISLQRRFLFK